MLLSKPSGLVTGHTLPWFPFPGQIISNLLVVVMGYTNLECSNSLAYMLGGEI